MKLCLISDLHGETPEIDKCDLCLIAGDLTGKGSDGQLQAMYGWINQISRVAGSVVFIAGNHDFGLEKMRVSRINHNVHYLYNESVVIKGLKIWGTPHTLRFCDWAFNSTEEELYKIMSWCPKDTDIILSHGPPRGILDSSKTDAGLGSVSLKLVCDDVAPKLCVFGHIHESVGQVQVDRTLYVNASYVNDQYKPNHRSPIYIEL